MVLKRLFKSKEQRNKDRLKTDLKKKISNVGGGRSNQGTAKRLKRELKAVDGPKKEVKKTVGGAQANKRKRYGNNQTGGGGNTTNKKVVTKTKSNKKLSSYEMKQAERKAVMQKKAGAKHSDFQKMRKGTMSKEAFIKKYPRSNTAKKYGKK